MKPGNAADGRRQEQEGKATSCLLLRCRMIQGSSDKDGLKLVVEHIQSGETGEFSSLDELGDWLREASRLTHNTARAATAPETPQKLPALTRREREIVALLGEGMNNRQIAGHMRISERTVRQHLGTVFQKLDVKNRSELLIWSYRQGLLSP